MARYTYICHSKECNGREFNESRANVAQCTNCGSNDIQRKSSNKGVLLLLPLIGLLGFGAWYAASHFDFGSDMESSRDVCDLVTIKVAEQNRCGYQIEPVFSGGCQPDTLFWSQDEVEQPPLLTSMGQFDVSGDRVLRFALKAEYLSKAGKYKELRVSCNPKKRSPAELKSERKRIEEIIQACIANPFSAAKYDAFDATKSLPDSTIRLPDGRLTSGISWQNLILLLWPDEPLKTRVELDDYGDITNIYFSK